MNLQYFQSLTRDEISKLASSGAAVLVPLGATEQHGPHLPSYTDSLICEYICETAISRLNIQTPLIIAPMLSIGCSQHHLAFGGTLSFRSSTYLAMLQDIGESLIACGFTKIIFLNSHGGNESIMLQVANDLLVKHRIWVAAASYWNLVPTPIREQLKEEIGPMPGHAGIFETALVKALRPQWVKEDCMVTEHDSLPWLSTGMPNTLIGTHGLLTGRQGYTDAPIQATIEMGQQSLEIITQHVTSWLELTLQTMEKTEC